MSQEQKPKCASCGGPRETRALMVRGYDDLKRFGGFRHHYDAVRFALPSLTENENRFLEDKFRRDYFECGCTAGGYAMGICLVLGCALFIRIWYRTGIIPLDFLPYWLGLVLASTLAAKGTTILLARQRLARRTRQLDEVLRDGFRRTPRPALELE